MTKKTKSAKRVGRNEKLSPEDLLTRFRALKRFLEDNWGRIGLRLQRVRSPNDVGAIFKLVPGVEWCPPFRDHSAKCLLEEGSREVGVRQLRQTQKKHEDAVDEEDRCWSEFHPAQQEAHAAKAALTALIQEYGSAKCLINFLRRVFTVARELEVRRLVDHAALVQIRLREAQEHQQRLRAQRSREEGWFARNEVVKFARSGRYIRSPINFAKAMAGLPEYSWIHSFRTCPEIEVDPVCPATFNYQLFQILDTAVKRGSRLTIKNIETMVRNALLKRDPRDLVRVHFSPQWAYIEQGLASCVVQRCKRSELAYMLMEKIQDNLERGKTITDIELAKRRQLM